MSQQSDVPTAAALIERVTQLGRPAAFQALWDGDTEGWMVCLDAVFASGATHTASSLVVLRFGGDIRLFQGTVPPWPEARVATELGEALATHFGVPFWFPSPVEPDSDCPAWWEQDRAHPCQDCGKLILPRKTPHLPNDICYQCYLQREARAELRRDDPVDADVTVLLGASGEEHQIGYASIPSELRIARFALENLDPTGAAPLPRELVLDGDQLRRFEKHLQVEVQTLLARFDHRPASDLPLEGLKHRHKVTFEGRELELELDSTFNDLDRELYIAIEDLETARRAIRDGLRYWLVFGHSMTARGGRVLRLLRQLDGVSTIAALVERCRGDLDTSEVRTVLARLAELGHLVVEGDSARLTPSGWHVGG
jgi:hypothetical protein